MFKLVFTIVVGVLHASGQYIQSPCPKVFEYKNDQNGVFGVIHIDHKGPTLQVTTQVNYTVATNLPSGYVGSIQPLADENGSNSVVEKIFPINLRVNFPVQFPLPRITSITVNDNIICQGPGDVPGSNQYVTTANLVHRSFIDSAHSAVSRYNYAYQYNGNSSSFSAENYSEYAYFKANQNNAVPKNT